MKKLTAKLGLFLALTAILFTACQKDTLINNAIENVQLESSQNIDYRNTITNCGITVSTSGLTVTLTENSNSANTIVTVTTPNWSSSEFLCNDHEGDNCISGKSLTVPNAGNYVVHVQIQGGTDCSSFNITLSDCTIDNDGDGVCWNLDCDDNDPDILGKQPQGTACDDGDSSTSNDTIQADGCSCTGAIGCQTIKQYDITLSICDQTISLIESNSPYTIVRVTTPNWSIQRLLCNDYEGDDCISGKSVTVPSGGTYHIHVQPGGIIEVQI